MSVTSNSRAAPGASRTLASATESATGPWIRAEIRFVSGSPASVQIALAAAQSVFGTSDTVTGPKPSGFTVTVRCAQLPSTRRDPIARPPVTSTAARIMTPLVSVNASLNTMWTLNFLPSCSAGGFLNRAVSGGGSWRVSVCVAGTAARATVELLVTGTSVNASAASPLESVRTGRVSGIS